MKFMEQPARAPQNPDQIVHRAVERLREPVLKLLEQISPEIERHEYSMIIGEDASGRIPALVFRKILDDLYKEDGSSPTPELYFVAGNRSGDFGPRESVPSTNAIRTGQIERAHTYETDPKLAMQQKEEDLLVFFENHKPEGRILVVTDTIVSGMTIRALIEPLIKLGYPFDVVTLSADEYPALNNRWKGWVKPDIIKKLTEEYGVRIFAGGHDQTILFTDKNASSITGVEKHRANLHAHRRYYDPSVQGAVQKRVAEVHSDVDLVADQITEQYKKGRK